MLRKRCILSHGLGIALNYKDDPRLRDTHVLNPRWVTNGIYRILNARNSPAEEANCRSTRSGGAGPKCIRPSATFLLELMRKFELCFTFPDDQGRYLHT